MEYEKLLSSIYPSGKCFQALLPRGDSTKVTDLSAYRLRCLGLIQCGSFSAVYRACDEKGNDCAVKITSLINGDIPPGKVAELALREIDICTEMMRRHTPGVMPLYRYYPNRSKIQWLARNADSKSESELANHLIVEVMPLGLPYDIFMKKLANDRHFRENDVAALLLDLMTSLVNVHNRQVIHRDVKPANLMLIMQEDGSIRVMFGDFNVSKEFPEETDNDYTLVGTKDYMHHDIMTRSGAIDRRTAEKGDVYSVGVIIYQMLNGGIKPPDSRILPRPVNCPSDSIFRLLTSMLSSSIEDIPTGDEIVSRLLAITEIENERVPTLYANPKPREQKPAPTVTALEGPRSLDPIGSFERSLALADSFERSLESSFNEFDRIFTELDKLFK